MRGGLAEGRSGPAGWAARVITLWALLGGALLLAVVAMNVISVLGGIVARPFPGDFELTQIGVAVAVFAFLPYCQLTGANVTADIFTARAAPRLISALTALGSAVALAFACLLVWRMYFGMGDQRQFDYTTAIVQFPIWLAFLPILVSLVLLAVASLITLTEQVSAVRRRHG